MAGPGKKGKYPSQPSRDREVSSAPHGVKEFTSGEKVI